MTYIVSASDRDRKLQYRHGSMMSALQQGLTLLGCGLNDVCITDLDGNRRTPAEFTRFLMKRDGASEAYVPGRRYA